MMKTEQKGTLAGLVMIGLALAWAIFDTGVRVDTQEITVADTSEARASTRSRRPASYYHASATERSSERVENPAYDLDDSISENAEPQHRVARRGAVALNDTTLLNNSPSTRSRRPVNRKLTERESLKALRLGARNSESVIPIDRALAATDPEGGFPVTSSQRAEAIRALALQVMDSAQIEAVYEFVEKGTPPEGISESTYRWLSDELFIALRNQENVPSDLVQRLSKVASNPEQDAVLRDYALQHLGHYHEESGNDLEAIEQTLWKATDSKKGTIAGTALIALTNAHNDGRMVSNYDLQTKAVEILKGDYTEESKISALEALRGNESKTVTSLVQNLATNEKTPVALKTKAQNQL